MQSGVRSPARETLMTACKTCGRDAGGPIFWDGSYSTVEWPDECHECCIARYKDQSERITLAFIRSGLSVKQASEVTGIPENVLAFNRERWEDEGIAYMTADYEPYILESACNRAVTRLTAAGRKAGTLHRAEVIAFPDKAERQARKDLSRNS